MDILRHIRTGPVVMESDELDGIDGRGLKAQLQEAHVMIGREHNPALGRDGPEEQPLEPLLASLIPHHHAAPDAQVSQSSPEQLGTVLGHDLARHCAEGPGLSPRAVGGLNRQGA